MTVWANGGCVLPRGVLGFVAQRDMGDHVTVSTDEGILADVAEISLTWMDAALYGNPTALDASADPCADCPDGEWTVMTKHLDQLGVG
jgi:hypothetical protein